MTWRRESECSISGAVSHARQEHDNMFEELGRETTLGV